MTAQVVLNEQKSTYDSPYGFYTVTLTPSNRTMDSVDIKCDVSAHLQFDDSWTGYRVTCGLCIGDGEWADFVLYAGGGTADNGKAWKGTSPRTASTTITLTGLSAAQTTITGIKFRSICQNVGGPQLNATDCADLSIDLYGGIANLNVDGAWVSALTWLNVDGVWKMVLPWVRDTDAWRSIDRVIAAPALGYSNLDNAYEAVKCAISYWNAKKSGSETFEYSDGNGPLKGATSAQLHKTNGNAVIDCSTYVGLILRGYGYLDSPYYNSAETTIDPRTVVCLGGSWAESDFDKQATRLTGELVYPTFGYQMVDGSYRVLTASDMAKYYDLLGLFWYADDPTMTPRVGDLCFFYKENDDGTLKYPTRFHGISHVGIMTDDSHYLNATDYDSGGDLIRTSCASRPPFAYARPYYGALTDGESDSLTSNIDLIPNVWAGRPQGSSAASGVTFSLSGKAMTLSGTATGGTTTDVISQSCPLYLPAGTYKLSGFANGSGTNTVSATHSMWGLRVYDASTGKGITGTTTSSNGKNTAERTPVWDVGGGAVFTLNEPTWVYINLWLPGSRDVSTLSATPVLYKEE